MIRALWNRLTGKRPAAPSRTVQMHRSRRFPPIPETTHELLASYDAATVTDHNSRHWANADSLSADAANSREIRERLRTHARYEAQENNSFAKGIVLTLANDCIGTGPRLQLLTGSARNNQRIEQAFSAWARQINLASKLRTMRLSKAVDGEAFAWLISNQRIPRDQVQLDLFLVEAEQVSDPMAILGPQQVDGIVFDRWGNPIEYHILKEHPGSQYLSGLDFDPVAAEKVIHLFRCDRPGQHRGIPEITTALPLFAQLRRFTLATLAAAETAADFAGVMFTDAPAIASPDDVSAMQAVELERNAMLTLPRGWKMGQMRAEHPSTTYEMFRNAILNEIARCVHMPFNIAAGNSSGYNYASAQMDHATYHKAIEIDRDEFEGRCLDRLLVAWFDEAVRIPGLLPGNLGAMPGGLPHEWHWDNREPVDPAKNATAQEKRLKNGTSTLEIEYAKVGLDWEAAQESMARSLGVTVDEYRELLRESMFGSGAPEPPEMEEVEDEQEQETAR